MAIELVPQLVTGAPSIGSNDWDKMIGLVSANEVPDLSFLTGWETKGSAPVIKQGVYIYNSGATYRVNNNDETISGSLVAGINYIKTTVAAGVMTLEWISDKTGFSYNPAYAGIYDSSDNQLLLDVCYLDGTDYIRGRSFGQDPDQYYLSDGRFSFGFGGARLYSYIPSNVLLTKVVVAQPNVITDDGTNLIVSDGTTIYIYDGFSNSILSSFSAPGGNVVGLAYDGTNLISADVNEIVYIHTGVTSSISSSFSNIGIGAMGDITVINGNLITSDVSGNQQMNIHTGITSTISSSLPLPSSNNFSLTTDGINLIIFDQGAVTIYLYQGLTGLIMNEIYFNISTQWRGITYNNSSIYISEITNNTVSKCANLVYA